MPPKGKLFSWSYSAFGFVFSSPRLFGIFAFQHGSTALVALGHPRPWQFAATDPPDLPHNEARESQEKRCWKVQMHPDVLSESCHSSTPPQWCVARCFTVNARTCRSSAVPCITWDAKIKFDGCSSAIKYYGRSVDLHSTVKLLDMFFGCFFGYMPRRIGSGYRTRLSTPRAYEVICHRIQYFTRHTCWLFLYLVLKWDHTHRHSNLKALGGFDIDLIYLPYFPSCLASHLITRQPLTKRHNSDRHFGLQWNQSEDQLWVVNGLLYITLCFLRSTMNDER